MGTGDSRIQSERSEQRTDGNSANWILHSCPPNFLQLLQGPRPVIFEQSRQAPIRQQFPAGLALRAVVGFIVCVDNALDS
jgi:hypothetical protein